MRVAGCGSEGVSAGVLRFGGGLELNCTRKGRGGVFVLAAGGLGSGGEGRGRVDVEQRTPFFPRQDGVRSPISRLLS